MNPPKNNPLPNKKSAKKKRKWIKKSKYQRIQRKIKRKTISIVYNYSHINLTPAMEKLLNRGPSFAIRPPKLNISELMADHKRLQRGMMWMDYFSDKENPPENKNFFKKKKSNFPSRKKYSPPEALQVFLKSTRSELEDPENRNKNSRPNLEKEEVEAMNELITLQRNREIKLAQCDKGGGLILLDFDEYVGSCHKHLSAVRKNEDGSESPYYKKVDNSALDQAKAEILAVLKDGKDQDIITEDDFQAMDPTDKGPARYYQTFKVHKSHTIGQAPPERPIVSGSGSITENISHFVQHHIKDLSHQHPTYIHARKTATFFLRRFHFLSS